MNFQQALSTIEGAQSAGGHLIVNRGGKNILVGKHVQGNLIVEDTDEARDVLNETEGPRLSGKRRGKKASPGLPETTPQHHVMVADEEVGVEDGLAEKDED